MDPTLILLVVALGAFIVFQIFQGRKRRRETEDRQTKFVPGVEIMTNYGLYGTILSIDDDTNVAEIETTPGTVLKIHRQTILKVADYEAPVEDAETDAEDADAESVDRDLAVDEIPNPATESDSTTPVDEPAYGERAEPVKKPTRRPTRKPVENADE